MFGRATIRLGIGPHSSSLCCSALCKLWHQWIYSHSSPVIYPLPCRLPCIPTFLHFIHTLSMLSWPMLTVESTLVDLCELINLSLNILLEIEFMVAKWCLYHLQGWLLWRAVTVNTSHWWLHWLMITISPRKPREEIISSLSPESQLDSEIQYIH